MLSEIAKSLRYALILSASGNIEAEVEATRARLWSLGGDALARALPPFLVLAYLEGMPHNHALEGLSRAFKEKARPLGIVIDGGDIYLAFAEVEARLDEATGVRRMPPSEPRPGFPAPGRGMILATFPNGAPPPEAIAAASSLILPPFSWERLSIIGVEILASGLAWTEKASVPCLKGAKEGKPRA